MVVFKVKIQRWRGAVFTDGPDADVRTWLVAAGSREDRSPDDFYATLEHQATLQHRANLAIPRPSAEGAGSRT